MWSFTRAEPSCEPVAQVRELASFITTPITDEQARDGRGRVPLATVGEWDWALVVEERMGLHSTSSMARERRVRSRGLLAK